MMHKLQTPDGTCLTALPAIATALPQPICEQCQQLGTVSFNTATENRSAEMEVPEREQRGCQEGALLEFIVPEEGDGG
jgi:hypothetical protein